MIKKNLKKICVVGMGYIGLPTSVLLSNAGYDVCGVDLNKKIVQIINSGKSHFVEKGLNKLVQQSIKKKKLKVHLKPQLSDIYIICVPTPIKYVNSIPKPDLSFVFNAVSSISGLLKSGDYIILESTCPVGTTLEIKKRYVKKLSLKKKIHIAYCPERVLPGNILDELIYNNRIVGGLSTKSTDLIANFYKTFVKGKVLKTDSQTAEMCKLTENSFRDVNIAFANELSILCDKQDVNVLELIKLANNHPRVNILQPGTGVGGHCIAVDPWFLVEKNFKDTNLIRAARKVNDYKTEWVIKKINLHLTAIKKKIKSKPKIIFFGISFKPNVDDLRGSPALKIIKKFESKGYTFTIVDPHFSKYKIDNSEKIESLLKHANLIVTLVAHKEFSNSFFIKKLYKYKYKTIDFCNLLNFNKTFNGK
jgi:UDP-N-acetyl-D-mannosaminuronic acid dehydrogenase